MMWFAICVLIMNLQLTTSGEQKEQRKPSMGSAQIAKLRGIWLLALVQFAFVSNSCLLIKAAAKVLPNENAELRRSMARYRQLLQQVDEQQDEVTNKKESKEHEMTTHIVPDEQSIEDLEKKPDGFHEKQSIEKPEKTDDSEKNMDEKQTIQSSEKTTNLEIVQYNDAELKNTDEAGKVSETGAHGERNREETKVEESVKEVEEINVKQPDQEEESVVHESSSTKTEETMGERQGQQEKPVEETRKESENITGNQQDHTETSEMVVKESENGPERVSVNEAVNVVEESEKGPEKVSGIEEGKVVEEFEKGPEKVRGNEEGKVVEEFEKGPEKVSGNEEGKVVEESEKGRERRSGNEEANVFPEPAQETVEVTGEQQRQERDVEKAESTNEEKETFVFPEPYLLTPTIKDWDEQRAEWLESNPHMKLTSEGKPRVLIVTGSQPWPCQSPVGDNFHIKSLKIKIDYARMHKFDIYYNFVWLDPLFGGYWVKLPTLRNLMLQHPEIEWFLWVDSDAMFTDMMFEIPFDTYDGYNMVMWGMEEEMFRMKNWMLFNAGVFFLRNCQWSLDLFDKWSPMGPYGPVRDAYGKMLTSFLSNRAENYPADDQSALAYLLLTDDAVRSKLKLVQDDYKISSWWIESVFRYEEMMEKYHPGLGDWRWPFVTHFTGCSPCNGNNNPDYPYEMCMENFNRAFNFADNQVLAFMGFQHESLTSPDVFRIRNETTRPLELLGDNPWKDRIAQYEAQKAST